MSCLYASDYLALSVIAFLLQAIPHYLTPHLTTEALDKYYKFWFLNPEGCKCILGILLVIICLFFYGLLVRFLFTVAVGNEDEDLDSSPDFGTLEDTDSGREYDAGFGADDDDDVEDIHPRAQPHVESEILYFQAIEHLGIPTHPGSIITRNPYHHRTGNVFNPGYQTPFVGRASERNS